MALAAVDGQVLLVLYSMPRDVVIADPGHDLDGPGAVGIEAQGMDGGGAEPGDESVDENG